MPVVADYHVIRDSVFELLDGQELAMPSFALPDDYSGSTFAASPILMWKARPMPNGSLPAEATVNVRIDPVGHSVDTVSLRGNTVHGMWEVVNRTHVGNDIFDTTFVFRSNAGRVRISDVVLWYQRGI